MKKQTKNELINLIKELVQIPSENPPGNEKQAVLHAKRWFENHEIQTKLVEEPYKERPQLIAKIGEGSPRITLNGHIDTVPIGTEENWKHPPLGAQKINDKIYGRGTCDMKANLALAMVLAKKMKKEIENEKLGTLSIQIAIGEETGEPGTEKLIEHGEKPDFAIVLEPTKFQTATIEKGLAWYEIKIRGEPTHASQSKQENNPIINSIPLLEKLKNYDKSLKKKENIHVGPPNATITKYNAGNKENMTPEKAEIIIDRRITPEEDIEEIDKEIKTFVNQTKSKTGSKIELKRKKTYEPAKIKTNHPLSKTFKKNSKLIANVPEKTYGTKYSSDVRNFINDHNIPAITWGPHDPKEAHTIDEKINLNDSILGFKILKKSVGELLKKKDT